jgi:aldehyde dehydrogenase (NAD+)
MVDNTVMTRTSAPSTSPTVTSEPYASVAERLRATYASGRTRSYEWRLEQLRALDRLLTERKQDIQRALGEDLRRTPFEATLFDISATRGEVKHAIKHLARWMKPRKVHAPVSVRPGRAWYQYEPLGVVLIIGPWNYPVHLTLSPLVAAFAAGNCAVIKPSEITPACSRLLADLLPRYVDPDAVAVVEGGPEASLGLIDQALDHCFFTGSPAIGSAVMAAAAPHLTPVTLELGGKSPAIVASSADLEVTARRIAFGKLVNSGQTCVAPDYILVDRKVRDAFVDQLVSTVDRFSEGKPKPIVNSRHASRLAGLLQDHGGRVALGGHIDVTDATAEPTIVVDPWADSALMREAIFGPLLPVVSVDSVDEAVKRVQQGGRPLATYLFTEDAADEQLVLEGISTGGTVVNHVMMHLAVSDLPFGGVGTSGMGRYHGHWGFETFSNATAVVRKPSRPDPTFMYPPWSGLAQRVMNRLM